MTDSIETRVARGAALLDENVPGWWRQVDLGSLKLNDSCHCVLGQLYATAEGVDHVAMMWTGYDEGKKALGLGWPESVDHGFTADGGGVYPLLDEAWIATIKDHWERLA